MEKNDHVLVFTGSHSFVKQGLVGKKLVHGASWGPAAKKLQANACHGHSWHAMKRCGEGEQGTRGMAHVKVLWEWCCAGHPHASVQRAESI